MLTPQWAREGWSSRDRGDGLHAIVLKENRRQAETQPLMGKRPKEKTGTSALRASINATGTGPQEQC